jgi:hypothetical protein
VWDAADSFARVLAFMAVDVLKVNTRQLKERGRLFKACDFLFSFLFIFKKRKKGERHVRVHVWEGGREREREREWVCAKGTTIN